MKKKEREQIDWLITIVPFLLITKTSHTILVR